MNAVLIYLDSNDRRLSDHLENWCPPRWIRFWMVWSTKLGDGWLWAFVAMTLIWRGEHATFVAAGLACCAANIAMIALKRRFRRCRPRAQAANQLFQLVRADLSGFDGFSFPSGHTMNAFAISVVLLAMHPRLLPVLAFAATSIGASRVVLRMHFVTDVVAGAILGAAIGSVVLRAM